MPDISYGERSAANPASNTHHWPNRPETVESLFIAFRLTGDNWYRDQGWRIFQSIQRHCKIESGGYASVTNVDELPVNHEDKMETFMMVITLLLRRIPLIRISRARPSSTCISYSPIALFFHFQVFICYPVKLYPTNQCPDYVFNTEVSF